MSEQTLTVTITANTERFVTAMRRLAVVAGRAARAYDELERRYRRAQSQPPPLCIDGRAYRARQRNRVKRGRRG